jgi:hypothetical protein
MPRFQDEIIEKNSTALVGVITNKIRMHKTKCQDFKMR